MMFCAFDRRLPAFFRKSFVTSMTLRRASIVIRSLFDPPSEGHRRLESSTSSRGWHRHQQVSMAATRFGIEGWHESTADETGNHWEA
jgi:hypothetical protein